METAVRVSSPPPATMFKKGDVPANHMEVGEYTDVYKRQGVVIAPTESQSRLNKELFRKAIDGYTFPNDTTCRYECTLAESELAGKEISEIGLYDTNGDIVCIKTFTRKGKDDDVEQTYVLDDIF